VISIVVEPAVVKLVRAMAVQFSANSPSHPELDEVLT
jgi:hypothetical protein